jgi:hypothetical protein
VLQARTNEVEPEARIIRTTRAAGGLRLSQNRDCDRLGSVTRPGKVVALCLILAAACTAEDGPHLLRDGHRDAGRAPREAAADAPDANLPREDGTAPGFEAGVQGDVPVIPVGLDAYRMWERLPSLRIGARTYMRSTYDRAGGNEGADASHFLRQEADDRNVTLDVAGTGVLYFVRTNHWHGSPWHYVVDGTDHVVQESSTADPTNPVVDSVFLPEATFPSPLTATWSVTKGADLSWVPVPFTNSLTLAYGRTHYGTGYYIYQLFPDGAKNLSSAVTSFSAEAPADDVLSLLRNAGQDIAPAGPDVDTRTGAIDIPAGATVEVASLSGSHAIRALKFRISEDQAILASQARLRITWDGRPEPSVDAPLALFFGTGSLYNRASKEWLVKGLLESVHFAGGDVELASYFPMPFFSGARVELVGASALLTNVRTEIRSVAYAEPNNWSGYFHATYRDHGVPVDGQDLVILDTKAVEGGGDFCGSFTGMSWIFSDRAELATLEGDPRFFFDDSESPQAYGTGTEEWAGGGDYWGGENMTLPLAGHPVGAPDAASARDAEDQIESAYRILVADAMPFGKNARIQLEHGGTDQSTEHYQSVAYWYGLPGACLELSDSVHVGDVADEQAHRYMSPTASAVESLTSRYELGVDHLGAVEVIPATTDTGRHMTGTTELTLALSPDNFGALLRRKLDYAFPNQRAEVFVADDRDGAPFARAGTWYLAGGATCVYSNPPLELDPPAPVVETSNRRFREDEFLIPRRLTEGRARVRVRMVFTPASLPLLPGLPPAPQAWSEYRYSAYSWVLPKAPP